MRVNCKLQIANCKLKTDSQKGGSRHDEKTKTLPPGIQRTSDSRRLIGTRVAPVARQHPIHPALIHQWIQQYPENPENAFFGPGKAQSNEAKSAQRQRTIGELWVHPSDPGVQDAGVHRWLKRLDIAIRMSLWGNPLIIHLPTVSSRRSQRKTCLFTKTKRERRHCLELKSASRKCRIQNACIRHGGIFHPKRLNHP